MTSCTCPGRIGRVLLAVVRITLALRLVGYCLLMVVLVATLIDASYLPRTELALWLIAYAGFAIAFHLGASAPVGARRRRLVALAIATPAMLAMAALLPCHFGALSLVLVASQAALVLTPVQATAWILAQTLVLGYFLCQGEAHRAGRRGARARPPVGPRAAHRRARPGRVAGDGGRAADHGR